MFITLYLTLEQFKRMQQGKVFGARNARSLATEIQVQITTNRIIEITEYTNFIQLTVEGGQ